MNTSKRKDYIVYRGAGKLWKGINIMGEGNKSEETNERKDNREKQVRSDNDASEVDILRHSETFCDILRYLGTVRKAV